MPSPRRPKSGVDYLDGHIGSEDDSSHRRSSRPRGYSPKLQRGVSETSLMTRERKAKDIDNNDSQFESETDYDPRDKYYLSDEEDPLDSHLSEKRDAVSNQVGRDHKSHSRHGSSRHGSSSRSGHTHSRSHGHHQHHHHSHRHSHSHPQPRDPDEDDHNDRHRSSAAPSKPSSHASRPRPRPSRASSSYLNAIRRPQVKRAGSSYKSTPRTRARPRPRPVRSLSHNSRKQAKPKSNKMPWEDFPWEDAAKVAFQAGGVALMKVGTEQMPWRTKGTKIASAALGAAVVDHVLKPEKRGGVKYAAMRHLAEVAVGNIVVPALGKVGAGGKKR